MIGIIRSSLISVYFPVLTNDFLDIGLRFNVVSAEILYRDFLQTPGNYHL